MSKNELRSSGERVSVILRMARVNCNKMSISWNVNPTICE